MNNTPKYCLPSGYQLYKKDFESRYLRSINDKRTCKKVYSVQFGDKLFVGYKGKKTWTTAKRAATAVITALCDYAKSWDAACEWFSELNTNGEIRIIEQTIVEIP